MVHCIHVAVSKVTSGKVLRDGVERIIIGLYITGFSERIDTILN